MKKIISVVAIMALAACAQADQDDAAVSDETASEETAVAGEAAGFEAVAPGSYDIVHADGTIDSLTIHQGMTWSTVFANNDAAGGTIFAQDGKNCFVTEGVEGHQCFVEGPQAEDGSMDVTSEDGQVMTVRLSEAAAE